LFYDSEQDPLCYPGTSVLINRADLRAQVDLDDYEFTMYLSRSAEPLPAGELDYAHYRAIHHHLFQDVYDWAGEPRTIRIEKGGNWFCYPENLERWMGATFAKLQDYDFLNTPDDGLFARRGAEIVADINAGHPFREGNGRTQLTFLKLLVINAGRSFNDDALDPQTTLEAMISSFAGELAPLTELISDIVA
jgi:cell filamentation protein